MAHELIRVGNQDGERQYVIRYSGNETFKDQMMQAFQKKWSQRLEKNKPTCAIRNLKEEDLITETESQSEKAESGHGFEQKIGQREGGEVGFQGETEVKMGCN